MNPRYSAPQEGEMLRCQEAIGYLFRRDGLLRKALTHSSVKDDKHPSNERLEFLGDAILGMVISEYLFSMLPHNDEGDLTKVKSVVVSSQSLSRLGLELGLDKYLLIGKGIRLKKEIPRSLVANAVEAVIAAVYLDRGMEAARHFILDHLHVYVEEVLADEHVEKNYKSLLQQCAQKELSGTPVYRVVGERGPDHSKSFRVAAVVNGREFPVGSGDSKKEAEQSAAKIALEAIEKDRGRPRGKGRRESNGNGRPAAGRRKDRPRATESKARAKPEKKLKTDDRTKPESRKRPETRRKPETREKPETRDKPEPREKPEKREKPQTRKKPAARKKAESRRKEPERPPLEAEKPAETKKRREPRRKVAPDREPAARKPAARVKGSRKAAKKPAKKATSDRRPARVSRNPEAARKPARTAKPSSRKKGNQRRGNR